MLLSIAAAITVPSFVPAGAADDCPTAYRTVTKVAQGGQTFYLDDRASAPAADGLPNTPGQEGGTWTYMESNHIAGLQTGGMQVVFDTAADPDDAETAGEVDTCHYGYGTRDWHTTKPDTITS